MSVPSRSLPDASPSEDERRAQINKRLTLNLLIQGAAAHTFITASHLVQDELEQLQPGLTRLHDRFAIAGQLNYAIGDIALMCGRPNRWWGFSKQPQKAFREHRFLATYGNQLAKEERKHLRKLAKAKGVIKTPVLHWLPYLFTALRVLRRERPHKAELIRLAIRVASEIWDIPEDRLEGSLTFKVQFGNIQPTETFIGNAMRDGAAGYGGVERRGDSFVVVAKAWIFPLLVHELVKGTAELVCLHGLNELDDDLYREVTAEADRIEYEPWLLQAGPAIWRRYLAVCPRGRRLAETLMHVARLSPEDLEALMMQIMEDEEGAKETLRELAGG